MTKPSHSTTVPIRGMHCRSCELLISDELQKLPGVQKVEVSVTSQKATITSKRPLRQEAIRRAVEAAGYTVGKPEELPWFNPNARVYDQVAIAAAIIFIAYFLLSRAGFINFSTAAQPSSIAIVLLTGLTAGLSTCMAVVGGLVLGLSARYAEQRPDASPLQKFRPHILFNLGRIASYALLGGVIGAIGKVFQFSGGTLGLLTIAVGLVMLLVGLQLTEVSPRLSRFTISLPAGLSRRLGLKSGPREYSDKSALVSGALTFFLPCGFTQAMQLYAMSTGSFKAGALIMGVFAVGTAPSLLAIGGITASLKGRAASLFFKGAGVMVAMLALFNISNGLTLTGTRTWLAAAFSSDNAPVAPAADNNIQNGVQIVRMDQVANGYKPNNFTVTRGVPVRWIVTSRTAASCAASLYAPKLGVRKMLSQGENIIEFTPNETGRIPFSCAMGMYSGSFNVVEKTGNAPAAPAAVAATPAAPTAAPAATRSADTQVLQAVYTYDEDIMPKNFTVKAGQPVELNIEAKDDGRGCMSSVAIPGLVNDFGVLEQGQTMKLTFTAPKPGSYYVTCAMGARRALITAT